MPKKSADLVLQGGVTSALVYIGLIRRLSRSYHFKSLGGASSGAVAAAAAAIAEHTRQCPPPGPSFDPFRLLGRFPQTLARTDAQGATMLFKLFQPQRPTERGWAILSAALRHWPQHKTAAIFSALGSALRQYPWAALAGLALGVLPAFWLWAQSADVFFDWRTAVAWVAAVLAGLLLGGVSLLAWVAWATVRGLVANHFGFCSGMGSSDGPVRPDPDRPPLTWAFHGLFNSLAGREADKAPITFGELWGDEEGERLIDLQVITTSLSLQRPYRLPGDPGSNPLQGFFYDPAEWAAFFPLPVLAWLAATRLPFPGPPLTSASGAELYALPMPRHWPVLMAVRLSLSFPVLLSAVPMYTLDGARDRHPSKDASTRFVARRVYFSDGGITNNCPVQLFDAALPSRPTFVVNLAKLPPGLEKRYRVWLHGDPGDPPSRVHPVTGAFGFAGSLIRTMLGWRDSIQMGLPGYRERIATVGLKSSEGGLNLAMPPATIHSLAALGVMAASRLDRAFNGPRSAGRANAWEQHRWVRLRSTLAAAQRYLGEFARVKRRAQDDHENDDPSYAALLAQRPALPPLFAEAASVAEAQVLLAACQTLAGDPALPPPDLGANGPEPAPRLRMSSPW
ncbi:RpoH suppressor SuhR [soil metagenome]